jgi:hypothetical protein
LAESKKECRIQYLLSIGIVTVFFITLASLEIYGRNSRITGQGYSVNDSRLPKTTVRFSDQVHRLWKQNGFRGRIVISLSRGSHFVSFIDSPIIPFMSFPFEVFNPSKVFEDNLRPDNFLLVSMETNIAREVVHVMSDNQFRETQNALKRDREATITGRLISVPFNGSPRTITNLSDFKAPDEPVLLYIDASIFIDYEPDELLQYLLAAGFKTDHLVFCMSLNERNITNRDREKLKIFKELLDT